MSLPPAMDCIGFCVLCVVNIISFSALRTDRAQEGSLLAKVTILTHLSGLSASCITAASHKAITDPDAEKLLECRGFRSSCKCLSCNLCHFGCHIFSGT